jgi:glycerol dehydrogenase-like iron-containing ADH family enzyme
MKNTNSQLYNYLLKSKKKFKSNININKEIQVYLSKSFKRNTKTFPIDFLTQIKIVKKISNNVLIVKNLNDLIQEFKKKKEYLFLVTKISLASFSKIYPEFKKNQNFVFYEDINTGKELKKIIASVKKKKYNIVCIGGGKITDLAKFISYKSNSLLLTIPTILATHVYASKKIHVLKQIKNLGYSLTIDGKSSDLALIDLKIIKFNYLIDKRFFLSGMGDLMAFYNSKLDWQLSPKFNEQKYSFALMVIRKVEKILEKININGSIEKWLEDYIFAQVLLCDLTDWVGSAPASGSEHFFANIYEKKYPNKILHGELVAFGTLFFRYVRNHNFKKIITLMNKFKINNSLNRLKISKKKIISSLLLCKQEGFRKKRYSILEEIKFDNQYITNIFNEMIKKEIIKP